MKGLRAGEFHIVAAGDVVGRTISSMDPVARLRFAVDTAVERRILSLSGAITRQEEDASGGSFRYDPDEPYTLE